MLKVINASVITPYRIMKGACVVVENDKITEVSAGSPDDCIEVHGCECIDAKGKYLSPGFIDIHTHGGGGFDFMDATVEAFLGAARMHVCHGTTALLPTTVSCSLDDLKKSIVTFQKAKCIPHDGAALLGLHLEGPYISAEQKGALDPRFIKNPDPDEYDSILDLSNPGDILSWSAAPELPGALEFARLLRSKGILVCAAHSDALFDEAAKGFENGFRHVTHLYSAMSTVRRINAYRHAGLLEYAFYQDGMTVEIIADGCHLPPSLLKLIYKIKGPDRIALVTDSMRAAGMPEGEYSLGSTMKVIVEDGVAKLMDRSAFAGSVATADRLVRTMVQQADVPLAQAVRMMTATPARIIGVDARKGMIAPGMDADLVLFDQDINIEMTIVGGKIVYRN